MKKGNCVKCHLVDEFSAPFTDDKFHNLGVGMDKKPLQLGREAITKKIKDRGKFKTPTLRHITQTAPLHARRPFQHAGGSGRFL